MNRFLGAIIGLSLVVVGCAGVPKGLEPVTGFEPERYLGTWYEIARLDHSFERNLSNVSATYKIKTDGTFRVLNRGFNTKSGSWKQIEGRARFIEKDSVGSLKVSFFGPFYGGYHIIALDHENYGYAMVVGPNRSYLWILSRQKFLEEAEYNHLVTKAAAWGFDTTQLIKVEHNPGEIQ